MADPSQTPSILSWIDSPAVRRIELYLWTHKWAAWTALALILVFIFFPQTAGALWYSFSNEPPVPTILRKMATIFQTVHFSASWITVPLGAVMFFTLLYFLSRGKEVSKTKLPSTGGIQWKATGTVAEPCSYQWLHQLADDQAEHIAQHVQLEKPFTYRHRFNDPIPSIGFKFPVRNHSVFMVGIAEQIKGEIYYDGVQLIEPIIVRHADSDIGRREIGGIAIEQRLTPTEAAHISKMQGTFHFSALEITIKGGTSFPQVKPERLGITEHEHSLSMQNERHGSLVIKRALYGANGTYADVTAEIQSFVVNERLTIDKKYNDLFRHDPNPHKYKTLQIDYLQDGLQFSITVPEDARFTLPMATLI